MMMMMAAAAAYAKLGQGLDADALESAATAVGSGSRRKDEASKKREADEAADGQAKVRRFPGCSCVCIYASFQCLSACAGYNSTVSPALVCVYRIQGKVHNLHHTLRAGFTVVLKQHI